MKIVPDVEPAAEVSGNFKVSVLEPSIPAVHRVENKHPLESRLKNWEAQQQQIRLDSMRRIYGLHEPVRREMEQKLASQVGY